MKKLKKGNIKKPNEEKELIKFLSNVALFENLTRNERKNLRQYMYVRNFKADEPIFKKGYPNVVLYIVKEGELNVYLDTNEKTNVLNTLKPLDFFGEIGLFLDEVRTASIIAVKDSVLVGISKKDLANFIDRFPRAGIKILYKSGEILSKHIINLNKKLNFEKEE
ncbi:MAG: cyclic nucleotide-binding domain-containing protein [Candidatus Cloacimonetes bacterium]|nr:cyclic nucleotide-binding domain-containing protein [Candidatus Cloacimonadota bacterium]